MCGFAGIAAARRQPTDDFAHTLERMGEVLKHRGPDDSGVWINGGGQCGFAFRRLAILDLSPNGHQPMSSGSGRFTLVFNGEIYNHLDVRRELSAAGFQFRGHSDTETLCAAFEHWGIPATVKRCIGMFAMAVWDEREQSLFLIRDRLGIKPLYLFRSADVVLFASELKAFRTHPQFHPQIDTDALEAFLRYLYIPAPATIYQDVQKVRPGHITRINLGSFQQQSEPFWSLEQAYQYGKANPFEGTEEEGVDALEQLLLNAVQIRKLSDVPLGALLSGGIDSTTVAALMQVDARQPARTFSIGFTAAEHDESRHAARIAQHLGTTHKLLTLDGSDALSVLPELPHIFDEPFADPSQIPTLLVCRMARNDVTVALTGDGGDELFGGYNRYIDGGKIIARATRVPAMVRRAGAAGMQKLADRWYPAVAPLLSQQRLAQQKLHKLANLLAADSDADMYRSLLSVWQDPRSILTRNGSHGDRITELLAETRAMPLVDRMMFVDQATYLTDELLAKVDRASMAVSLEARVPLLDHRVVEFSWRIPAAWKIRDHRGKWLLRQVLYRHVPAEMVDRPKVGFTVPIEEWLRGPLRKWGEESLQTATDPLNRADLMAAWHRFQRGAPGYGLGLWAAIMFQAWRQAWETP